MGAVSLLQFTELTLLVFCCNTKPVEGEGQETATVFVGVRAMESNGAPGVCTRAMLLQNPPSIVKVAPLSLPASSWPIVPRKANTAPVLVPPPPSRVNQLMVLVGSITVSAAFELVAVPEAL